MAALSEALNKVKRIKKRVDVLRSKSARTQIEKDRINLERTKLKTELVEAEAALAKVRLEKSRADYTRKHLGKSGRRSRGGEELASARRGAENWLFGGGHKTKRRKR